MNEKCYWCGEPATIKDCRVIDGEKVEMITCHACSLIPVIFLEKYKKDLEPPTYTDIDLIKALEEYIVLLGEEVDSMSTIASIHGWKSTKIEQGEKLRHKIELIKEGYTLF